MIALALLAVQAPAVPDEQDIVVMAQRMHLIRVDLRAPRRNGHLVLTRCRVTRPSGYAELDAIACDVAPQCIADDPPTRRALEDCVEARSQERLDAIVARWRAARAGQS